jgi:MoxR-like ATPase
VVDDLKERVIKEVGKVVVGRERETELLLVCLLARGHALLEGVPGVSKTLLAKCFARCLSLDFGRVQFTPDMLPMDILGGFVFNMKTREFDFRKGPVFTNLLLGDEINRAPPKVQSALLEVMQENQVTIEGNTEKLHQPFMVIDTENPVEFRGVYPLPEGQLDRFMVKVRLDYPTWETERLILRRNMTALDVDLVNPILGKDDLEKSISEVDRVKLSDELISYLSEFARASRDDPRVKLGASPRAMVHLVHCAMAYAYLRGRDYVIPDDVKQLGVHVLSHRIQVERVFSAEDAPFDSEAVVREVLDKVKPPR